MECYRRFRIYRCGAFDAHDGRYSRSGLFTAITPEDALKSYAQATSRPIVGKELIIVGAVEGPCYLFRAQAPRVTFERVDAMPSAAAICEGVGA